MISEMIKDGRTILVKIRMALLYTLRANAENWIGDLRMQPPPRRDLQDGLGAQAILSHPANVRLSLFAANALPCPPIGW
jgi:hypothetical protein